MQIRTEYKTIHTLSKDSCILFRLNWCCWLLKSSVDNLTCLKSQQPALFEENTEDMSFFACNLLSQSSSAILDILPQHECPCWVSVKLTENNLPSQKCIANTGCAPITSIVSKRNIDIIRLINLSLYTSDASKVCIFFIH